MTRRRIRYQVAVSLDGYIADADGGYGWIPEDPDIDFGDIFAAFDTLIMGRATFEIINPSDAMYAGMKLFVVSRTLDATSVAPNVSVMHELSKEAIEAIRAQPGKDIWLFGGGKLFRSMLHIGCVDTIEPAVIPVILGRGIPMFPEGHPAHKLQFMHQRSYEKSGIVSLQYNVIE